MLDTGAGLLFHPYCSLYSGGTSLVASQLLEFLCPQS